MPPRLVLWSCVVISIVYQIKITICGAPCTPALLSCLRRPFMFRVYAAPSCSVLSSTPRCFCLVAIVFCWACCVVSKGVTRSHQPATPAIPVKPVSRVRVFWGFELPTRTCTRDDP